MKTFFLKSVLVLLTFALYLVPSFAQSPEKMSYQAIVRDASNNLVKNQVVGMQISILQASAEGAAIYTETQTPTTNANGLVSIEIGTGATTDDLSTIDWAIGPYFIKTETDPTGNTSYTITGTSQLLSVPYALHAKTAETITGGISETDPTVTKYSVGDFAQGGIVFWVDETGQHGLVAAKVDQDGGSGIQWYNGNNIGTEAYGNGIYAGKMNTLLIIASQGSNSEDYAAGVCANYTVTESGVMYGDWYLPSRKELNLMSDKLTTINTTAEANGGSTLGGFYWSSTEHSSSYAAPVNISSGGGDYDPKFAPYKVRAVRSF